MKKLSIITINYNNLEGLKRTVESVVNQTWQEFEYIIIDGGSTDGSTEYIASKSENIDYWVSENDSGIYNAMNKGIKVANGEYLLFLNSGDLFYTNEVLKENEANFNGEDILCFDINLKDFHNDFIHTHPEKLSFLYLFERGFTHQSVLIKRNLFEKVGYYDESLKIVADWKFFMDAIIKFNSTYRRINSILSVFYYGGLSSTQDGVLLGHIEKEKVLKSQYSIYYDDYKNLIENRNLLEKNRFKMLIEIENSCSYFGKKMTNFFLKILLFIK